jgi:chromosome segregation ATPase
VYKDTIE